MSQKLSKKYYVAHFPNLKNEIWIADLRKRLDSKHSLVAPHLTLLSPIELTSANDLFSEAKRVVSEFKQFVIRFRSAIMMPEKSKNDFKSYIFLVPDEGFSNLVRLRSQLYSMGFSNHLRLDVPYVPHMTIGSNLNLSEAKAQVDQINALDFTIEFKLDKLSIVEIADPNEPRKILDSFYLR